MMMMDFLTVVLFIISCTIALVSNSRARRSSKLPPGPPGFPIIGNILELGPKPHQSLAKLSRKFGPILSLRLGSTTTIVVSSPEIAKIVLQTHDTIFSSRPIGAAALAADHHKYSIGWLPADHQWRKLRKICKEQMFSVSRMDASQGLRREKLQKLREYVKGCSDAGRALDIGEAVFTTSLSLTSATLFSREFVQFNSDSSQEMKSVISGILRYYGTPNLADYFPILKPIDPQGIFKQIKILLEKLFAIFDGIIDETLKSRGEADDNLIGVLIDIYQRDEAELSINDIKHLLVDIIVAGTETTSSTVEWAMTELLRHPDKLSRVGDEIKHFVEEKGSQVEESDIPRLPYLAAVVKETFRLHPPAPFLVPHKANSDVEINGYIVPQNAHVLVNVWASGRDPSIWSDADEFKPERFLNDHDIDYRGNNFELIPFGAGRRACPGLPLAHRMVHLMLATLLGSFRWELQNHKNPKEIDTDDRFGLTLQKATPLVAVPTKF